MLGIGMKSKYLLLKTDLWVIDMGSLLKLGLLYLLEHPEEMTVEVIPVEYMHMIILTGMTRLLLYLFRGK